MDVVDPIEIVVVVEVVEDEVVEDPVVDHLVLERPSILTMFVTNVVVSFISFVRLLIASIIDRGHYAYDCEIRLRRQRRMR